MNNNTLSKDQNTDNTVIVYQSKAEQIMDERNAQFIKDHPDFAYGVHMAFGVLVIGFIAFVFVNAITSNLKFGKKR